MVGERRTFEVNLTLYNEYDAEEAAHFVEHAVVEQIRRLKQINIEQRTVFCYPKGG